MSTYPARRAWLGAGPVICDHVAMRRPSRSLAVALLSTAALLLTTAGCGGGDDTLEHAKDYAKGDGSDIAKDARKAMSGLTTMHVAGTIKQGSDTIALDLSVSRSGSCTGTIGVGDGSIELRSVGGRAWYKADLGFWKAEVGAEAQSVAKAVGDRWVVLSGDLGSLRSFCRIDSLTGQMLDPKASVQSEGAAMVGSTPTARLSLTESGVDSVAYVQAAEPHRVLRITRGSSDKAGQVDFSAFDAKFDVQAPAAKDVFNPASVSK